MELRSCYLVFWQRGKTSERGWVRAPNADPELCALSNHQRESNGNTAVFLYDLRNLIKVHHLISTDVQIHTHACLVPKVPLPQLCCRGEAAAAGLIALCFCLSRARAVLDLAADLCSDAGQADGQLLRGFPSFPVDMRAKKGTGTVGNS